MKFKKVYEIYHRRCHEPIVFSEKFSDEKLVESIKCPRCMTELYGIVDTITYEQILKIAREDFEDVNGNPITDDLIYEVLEAVRGKDEKPFSLQQI